MILHSWKQSSCSLFSYEIQILVNLLCIAKFCRHVSLRFFQIDLCFIFGLMVFHRKDFWIVSKALIIWLRTGVIRAGEIIFNMAKLSKLTILPSRVRNRQRLNTDCTLVTILRKLHSSFIVLLYKKQVTKILKSDFHLPQKLALFASFESPLKIMNNAFYFILKAFFVLKILKFLLWLFDHVEKTAWLER